MNYGTTWILRDSSTQEDLADIGPRWAMRWSGNIADQRSLAETQLKAGSYLELVRFREESYPIMELLADGEKLLREEVVR